MSRIVFDIETLAFPLETLDHQQQEYLMRFARTEEEKEEALLKMSLTPFTAQIIAIGMLNPDSHQGRVLYQATNEEAFRSDDGLVEFTPSSEVEILQEFWNTITRYEQFITFNGRTFDCPFLMIRSALLEIRPTRNLLPYRYSAEQHCDLLEQLTYYGAFRKFNLDFYCKSFGIKSPKGDGITGLDLASLFQAGKYREIAQYCMGDVQATAELFHRWQSFLAFER